MMGALNFWSETQMFFQYTINNQSDGACAQREQERLIISNILNFMKVKIKGFPGFVKLMHEAAKEQSGMTQWWTPYFTWPICDVQSATSRIWQRESQLWVWFVAHMPKTTYGPIKRWCPQNRKAEQQHNQLIPHSNDALAQRPATQTFKHVKHLISGDPHLMTRL